MYALEVAPSVDRIFRKLEKKDPGQLEAINKKLLELRDHPHHFKPLRAPMHHLRRVHIQGSFVLIFAIHEARKAVMLVDYGHHDHVYR